MSGRWRVLAVFSICFCLSQCAKLNVPRILLPEDSQKASYFRLEVVEGGDCYQWRSSRPDLIQVVLDADPSGRDCSKSAVVSLAPLSGTSLAKQKATAFVLAEGEGETLYCDVVVSSVSRIEISVRTHEIFLDDVGQIKARAYDDQGNEFSTLDGLAMDWRIEPINRMESDIIRLVSFEDSKYDASESVERLEKLGKRGDMILIEGAKTGSAKINVRFLDPSLKDVPAGEVRMTVIANIALDPPRAYLMPGSSLTFRIIQFRHGRLQPLPLIEAQQYLLQLSNDTVATVTNPGLLKVTAFTTGETQVLLRDPNLDEEGPHPTATIFVVFPAKLKLSLLPYKNWVTFEGIEHVLDVEIFDEFDNKIHPSEEVSVKTHIAPRFVEVRNSTQNGTWSHIYTTTQGVGKVKATLNQLVLPDGTQLDVKPPAKASADIEIYPPIHVDPTVRLYPWDPITKPKFEAKFTATGGGDGHIWASSNTSVATVGQTGLATTMGVIGAANISAAMAKNQKMKGVATLFVLPAVDVKIALSKFEFEEKSTIPIPIGLYGRLPNEQKPANLDSLQVFSDCSQVPFDLDLTDKKTFVLAGETSYSPIDRTCAQVSVMSRTVGSTKATISYPVLNTVLKDTVTISTFRKLQPSNPASGMTVLSLGASRTVLFEGGPMPWVLKPSGHFYKVSVENATVAKPSSPDALLDEKTGRKDFYSVVVTCLEIGETKATLRVGNVPSSTNQNPVVVESNVTIVCAEPKSLELRADLKRPEGAPLDLCIADPVTQRVKSQSYEDLKLIVTLKDADNRRFDNFSSVALKWSLSDNALGSLHPSSDGSEAGTGGLAALLSSIPKNYQLLKPVGTPGPIDVTVSLAGYDEKVLKAQGIHRHHFVRTETEEEMDLSTDTLNLLLVDDVKVDKEEQTIFNHPNNKLSIVLQDGSGVFGVSIDKKEIASFVHLQENQTIQVLPVRDGMATLTVKDLCLTARSPATAVVRVASLERIEVEGPEKVALGGSIGVHVRILDTAGNQLSVANAKFLNLSGKAEGNFVGLRFEPDASSTDFVYTVVGLHVGLASLSFSADKGIRSSVLPVEVFAPLKLEPKSLTLIIGSNFQLKAIDGPQPDPNLSYSVADSTIASVSQTGLILALSLGHTRISGKSLGPHGYVYSEDTIELYVVPFNGVQIRSPTVRIVEGGEVPVTVWGHDGRHTPFAFGMAHQQLTFKWSAQGSGKALLRNSLSEAGLSELPSDKDFNIVVVGQKAGTVRLRVKVSVSGASTAYEDEIQIEIIPRLGVSLDNSGEVVYNRAAIMSVNSKLNLGVNRKADVAVEYKANGNVTVDSNGLVRAGSSVGFGTVLITSFEGPDVVQRATLLVEILPVAYAMLRPMPLEVAVQSSSVPTGYLLNFRPTYYDSLGRKFDTDAGKTTLRLNRFDLAEQKVLQNDIITIRTQQAGQTVIRYQDIQHPSLIGYLGIHSVEGVKGKDGSLTVGDFLCLSSLTKDGLFKTSGPVVIDAAHGIGFANGQGAVEVSHTAGKQVTTKQMTVKEPLKVEFIPTSRPYITNADPQATFIYPLVFKDNTESKDSNLVGGEFCDRKYLAEFASSHRLPFDCHLAFTDSTEINVYDVFKVRSAFDATTGRYVCVIEVANLSSATMSTIDRDLILSVQGRTASLTQSVTISFRPAIYLQSSELHLTNLQTELPLLVSGVKSVLDGVQVRSSDPNLLTVGHPEYRHTSALVFPIKLRPDYWTLEDTPKLSLSVTSSLTGQTVNVPVHVRLQLTERDRCTIPVREKTWYSVVSSLLEEYQLLVVTLLTILATTAIFIYGSRLFRGGYTVIPDEAGVFLSKTSPVRGGMTSSPFSPGKPPSPFSPDRPRLWTVDHDHSGYGPYSARGSPPPYTQSPNGSFR